VIVAASLQSITMQSAAIEATSVVRLALTDFRSYAALRLDLDARPVVLTGPNGAGKTNLLEALSFLAPGRGLRGASLAEVGRRDAGEETLRPWAVAAALATQDGEVEIGTGLAPETDAAAAARRVVRIDGKPQRGQSALAERVGALWITPEMDTLFGEGSGARRRFLDRLVFGVDAAHAERLAAYERSLRERARLLRGQKLGEAADPAWLAALERAMAEQGIAVTAARQHLIFRLNAACEMGVGPFPAARLALKGEVEALLDRLPALDAEEAFREHLLTARARDAETGGAAIGPHKSDLEATHVSKGAPAGRCSTGEQKALLISIVLANARLRTLDRGAAPLLLLDEVAAHLDEERRTALYAEIAALKCQAWLTGTDEAAFATIAFTAQHFRVREANLYPA
jgi:DNA replication and repair protein RecF